MEKKRARRLMLVDATKGMVRRGEGAEGRVGGVEARTKSAERSAANPGSAKRYRIFAPFCGSGKRAEKNRRSREKIGRRSQAGRKNRAGEGAGGGREVDEQARGEVGRWKAAIGQ